MLGTVSLTSRDQVAVGLHRFKEHFIKSVGMKKGPQTMVLNNGITYTDVEYSVNDW